MGMKEQIEEFREKEKKIELGGGKERIEKQHNKGKMTARERIEKIFDPGSFVEVGKFVEHRATELGMDKKEAPADGVVTGYGTVNGKRVYAFSQDFTVIGGSLGEMHGKKICKIMDMAMDSGAPIIGINDSAGARIQEGIDALASYGEIFKRNTHASGLIPQISAVLGPSAGGACYSPAITDFIFMTKDTSKMFITGPRVVKEVTGEEIGSLELGGTEVHTQKSGVAQFATEDEEECIEKIKELLSYLPSNCNEAPPVVDTGDDPERTEESLVDIMPANYRKPYDVLDVIEKIVDNGNFLEVSANYAPNFVTAFARMDGHTVGILANQPNELAGTLNINASDKAARFIRFCDSFNIPLVTFVDVPGYMPGKDQEHGGIIRHGAKMLYAYSESTVPKITVILRKAYGGGYIGMSSSHLGADQVFAWPSSELAVMGPEGAAAIIYRKEIKEADDPESVKKEKVEEYREKFANPYNAASKGYVNAVIEPSETRPYIIKALDALRAEKKERALPKKHGNIPL